MPQIADDCNHEQLLTVGMDDLAQQDLEAHTALTDENLQHITGESVDALPKRVALGGVLLLCGLTVLVWAYAPTTLSETEMQRQSGEVSLLDEMQPQNDTTYNTIFNRTLAACIGKNPWSQIEVGKCYDWIFGRDGYCRAQLINGEKRGTCEQIANCLQEKDFTLDNPCDAACSFGHEELQKPVHEECSAAFEKVLDAKRACLMPDAKAQEHAAWDSVEPYLAKCKSYRTTSTTTWVDGSLFCFALVVPWSYEPELMRSHHAAKAGIFQCEDSAVYSDREIVIGDTKTRVLKKDLHCPFNPSTGTAENTFVFKALWQKVMEDGMWRYHDWTVKADPDTVLFPFRLKLMLTEKTPALFGRKLKGTWVRNCWHGLHGPIEIMSKNAVSTFNESGYNCPAWPLQEDNYLENCMGVLQIPRLDAFNILAERNCERPYYWTCQGSFAAFHPFKEKDAWKKCWDTVSG
eukprot:TRINITY_DN5404_c0_g2_i4.p1 TRINITY_DN5404_c0_g2~~TRINITY_DN5404_c0_g2_i4.p1  ORF type:complete len:476 (+),score=85.86 TRINITY_DN5404_c0_g2_i4:44-1429(+)